MICSAARDAIQEALDGLPPDPAMDAHLATCADCRSYQDGLQSVVARLSVAARLSSAAATVTRTSGRERATSTPGTPRTFRVPRARMWFGAGVVAASLAISLAAFTVGRAGPDRVAVPGVDGPDPDAILCLFGADPAPPAEDFAL